VRANPVVVDYLQIKVGVTFTPAQGERRERKREEEKGRERKREEERGRERRRLFAICCPYAVHMLSICWRPYAVLEMAPFYDSIILSLQHSLIESCNY
jgi:hypothetical protein